MKTKIYQTTREDLEKKFNMRAYGKDGLERRAKEEKLKIRANYGALAILEMKITEIENTSFNQNKNLEIHRLTIPYLHLQKTLGQYLSEKETKNFDLRYKNALKKYWRIKNEK